MQSDVGSLTRPQKMGIPAREIDAVAAETIDIDVYDFFSGCGGTSAGLRNAGLNPVIAVDFDAVALETYAKNFPDAVPVLQDIRSLHTRDIETYFDRERKRPVLMCACAPCQPFSPQNRHKRREDDRVPLLSHLRRFVERFRPELLLIENVPGLDGARGDAETPLAGLLSMLEAAGYWYDMGVLKAHEFGVPQSRRRLIVIASLLGPIRLPAATHGDDGEPFVTVRDAISHLPGLAAGGEDAEVADHRSAGLSALNLERIKASSQGGSWRDWPDRLRLACHDTVDGYTDVYGRLSWDRPAPALTTRCISYSNGRFGHPEQDRALSVREAACLQTFPEDFVFTGSISAAARQIGNAVPARLAQALGKAFMQHAASYLRRTNG